MLIEGRRAVLEALRSGVPGRLLRIAENVQDAPVLREIEQLASESGVEVRRVSRHRLDADSERGAHQGVVLHIREPRDVSTAEMLRLVAGKKNCLVFALDHVTDPGNMGAIARSAEVLGVSALLVPPRRTAAINPAAYKASAGAFAWLPVIRGNLVSELEKFKKERFWVAGADAGARQLAWDAPLEGRLVMVLGSEGTGLSRLVRERCDFLVALPVSGQIQSLNVAQAATVFAYEWNRRLTDRG